MAKPTNTRIKRDPSAPRAFAIVIERTVRLQHVLNVSASSIDEAVEIGERTASEMSDDDFDWREDAHDAWSAFGRRDSVTEAE
jgi:hypothetical protein